VLASDYGVPQDRRRVFFVGVNDRYHLPHDLEEFARAALAEIAIKTPVTVWEAIGDLPEKVVPSGEVMAYPKKCTSRFQEMMRLDRTRQPYSREIKNERGIQHFAELMRHTHHTKEIPARRASLISMLAPGAKADSLPKHIWNGARPEKWRRLHPDEPAYTILANMHRDLSEFVHPKLQRWITVREAARLQSFHDGFVFRSSEWQMLKQIGNAVPPLLGRAMAHVASSVLDRLVAKKGRSKVAARQPSTPRHAQIELPL
jgi:DNA (cytosine-5)-methyltransferase 1